MFLLIHMDNNRIFCGLSWRWFKGGPETPRKRNSRDFRIETWRSIFGPFFWFGTQYQFDSFFVPALPVQFLEGPAGHAKVPAEVPEDSRVLRVRRLWFPTSNHLDTWLIPSGTTRFRQYNKSTMFWRNFPPYHLLKCLLPLCHALFVEKDKTKY